MSSLMKYEKELQNASKVLISADINSTIWYDKEGYATLNFYPKGDECHSFSYGIKVIDITVIGPLKEGDRVYYVQAFLTPNYTGTIQAVRDDKAWVKWDLRVDVPDVVPLNTLKRYHKEW